MVCPGCGAEMRYGEFVLYLNKGALWNLASWPTALKFEAYAPLDNVLDGPVLGPNEPRGGYYCSCGTSVIAPHLTRAST